MAKKSSLLWLNGHFLDEFAPDPGKHLGTVAAGKVLKVGSGGDYNIETWIAACFWPTADGNLVLNGDSAKIIPIYSGGSYKLLIHPNVTQVVCNVEAIICGM